MHLSHRLVKAKFLELCQFACLLVDATSNTRLFEIQIHTSLGLSQLSPCGSDIDLPSVCPSLPEDLSLLDATLLPPPFAKRRAIGFESAVVNVF